MGQWVGNGPGVPDPTCGIGTPDQNPPLSGLPPTEDIEVDNDEDEEEKDNNGKKKKKEEKLWATYEVSLLAKITDAIHVKDFRPIAVLPVVFKLYSRVLYMLGDSMCKPLQAPQFAFRKFHQAHEVVFILRQLIEKAVEWRAPHIFVMDGDIKKAYDFVSHKAFAEAAREKGISEILIMSWLREWMGHEQYVKARRGNNERGARENEKLTPGGSSGAEPL